MRRLFIMTILTLGLSTISYAQQSDTLRILGFGNSWTRDSMRWLSAIAKSAGKPVIVGHAYLGGSTLKQQFLGIDDNEYQYPHGSKLQTVHSTYQYWKYVCTDNPVRTPDKDYHNGTAGIGVTLESVVKDEPWDIIVFQPSASAFSKENLPEYLGNTDSTFNMNALVNRVKLMMKAEVAAKVRTGLMAPFSFPQGCTLHATYMSDTVAEGKEPADQQGWDEVFEKYHTLIQKSMPKLAAAMGDNCSFIVNVGQAIWNARHDDVLSKSGYKLQRSQGNTHLSEGIAMYAASLCYAYCLIGIDKDAAKFYPNNSKDPQLTGDRGKTTYTTVANTPEMAARAREAAWKTLK